MSTVVKLVNGDVRLAQLSMDAGGVTVASELPVLATPAAVAAAAAWVAANKGAVAGAAAFGALFGAGVWVGVANAN